MDIKGSHFTIPEGYKVTKQERYQQDQAFNRVWDLYEKGELSLYNARQTLHEDYSGIFQAQMRGVNWG